MAEQTQPKHAASTGGVSTNFAVVSIDEAVVSMIEIEPEACFKVVVLDKYSMVVSSVLNIQDNS